MRIQRTRRITRSHVALVTVVALGLALPLCAAAQEFRATVKGQVVDPSDAAIPGCSVQVRNVETNAAWNTVTDSTGDYTMPFLPPGKYSLTFELSGFKTLTREGITLEVGQTAVINAKLEIGGVSDVVSVVAEAPVLESASASRGQVIDSKQILEIPLNGRSPYLLAILAPGANFNGEARFLRPFDLPHSWRMNGGLTQNNEFLLDGAPNNAQAGNNSVGLVPPVDAVDQFKVQTSSYDAQYGKTSGGIINVSLKSGTNDPHGTLYEFTRQSAWDANTFPLNAQSRPKAGHYLYESGGTIGGPVALGNLYKGRDKTFFFFSLEEWRESTPETGFHSVPTPEMIDQPDAARCGGVPHCADFSNLVQYSKNGPPTLIPIYDPLSPDPNNRIPFAGNIIPANRIDPIARRILAYMPAPNNLNNPNASFYSNNDFFRSSLDRDKFHNWAFKVDQNLSAGKHHLFVTGAHNRRSEFRQFNPVPIGQPGENAQDPIERVNSVSTADWVTIVKPSLIANVRFGVNRNTEGFHDLPNENFDLASFGFPASMIAQLARPRIFGDYNFAGYTSLGRLSQDLYTHNITVHPSITALWRTHQFKTGVDFRDIRYEQYAPGEHDVFRINTSRDFTRRVWNVDDVINNGNSIASFLLGYPNSDSVAAVRTIPTTVWRYVAPYVQDDWRVNNRLTLNLGLRMDFNVSPSEVQNRIDRGFDAALANPVDALVAHTVADPRGGTFTFPQVKGGLLFAGVNGTPTRVANLYATAVQPRAGFAYTLNEKAIVRGGFGRYYLNPSNDYLQYSGFNAFTNVVSSLDGGRHPDVTTIGGPLLTNPFPNGVSQPTGSSLGARTFLGQGFSFFNPDFKLPYFDQFSIGFEHELPWRSRVDVSYVGSRGHQLQTTKPFNEPSLAVRQACNPVEGGSPSSCADRIPNPFFGLADFGNTAMATNPTISRWDASRPFPEFGSITELGRNDGRTWYDSLQVNYLLRAAESLNLTVSYTLSKEIEQGLNMGGTSGWLDVQRGILNRSLTDDDQPHSLKIGSIWQLPLGHGRRFLGSASGVLDALLGGWEHTTVITYVSGRPAGLPGGSVMYLKNAHNPNVDFSKSAVQGWLPCVAIVQNGALTTGPSWDNALCGTDPLQAYFLDLNLPGDAHAPRFTNFRDPIVRLQSAPSVDMSLNKTTTLMGRTRLQFRAEAFNLFNTFRYLREGFNNNTRDKNFGTIIKGNISDGSNVGFPRQIQLAVKILF